MADLNFLLSSLISVSWSSYIHVAPQFCLLHYCSLCPRSTGILVSSISNDSHHLKKKKAWYIFNFIYRIIQCIPGRREFLFLLTLAPIWWPDWIPWVVIQLSTFHSLMGVMWLSVGGWSLDEQGCNLWWPVVGWPSAEATGKIRLCVFHLPGSSLGLLHRAVTVPRSVREQVLKHESFSSLCLLHGRNHESLTNPSQCSNSALVWPDALLPES